jgi:hypothetical protein
MVEAKLGDKNSVQLLLADRRLFWGMRRSQRHAGEFMKFCWRKYNVGETLCGVIYWGNQAEIPLTPEFQWENINHLAREETHLKNQCQQ